MSDDDYGFWDADRQRSETGPIPRLKRPVERVHHAAPGPSAMVSRRPGAAPNPGRRRIAMLCGVCLLALPVAVIARGSNNDATISSAEAAAAASVSSGVPLPAVADPATTVAVPAVAETGPVSVETVPAMAEATSPAVETVATVAATAAAAVEVQSADTARPVGIATPAVAEAKRTCDQDYTVQPGDYWISIADSVDVKLSELLTENGATVNSPLYPGRSICLPAGASSPTTDAPSTTAKPTATTVKPKTTSTTVKPTATTVKPKTTSTTVKPTATTVKPKTTTTTAPPTTVAPSTTAAPPHNNYTRAQVEQIIRDVWPDDLEDEAVRIATRESNLIPTVRNACCYGLFQIYFTANKSSLVSWGITSAAMLYDPQVNAYAAYAMYLRAGGWGPWAL
ncbi:MAG: hypothetical protein JWM34_4599 [Ilumatobacteraceae bacterium]|nr:hypothetical protein [Ilumatobacteraceae bacterium]